jgi:iron complex outermembrane receptor protein
MVAFEHNERTPLKASQRGLYTDDLRPFGGTDQRLLNSNPGNILVGTTRYGIPTGQNGVGLTAAQVRAASVNRFSAYEGVDAIPGQNRDSVIASIEQELSPSIKLWGQGYFAHRELIRTVAASTANLSVPRANPFFVHPTNAAATSVTVNYNFYDDFGPRQQDAYQRSWQIAGGLDADLGGGWNLTAYGSYGRNSEERAQQDLNNAQLLAALRDTNPLTAFNAFGDGSYTNAATLAKIRAWSAIGARYDLSDFGAKIDGTLFDLPGGGVKLAVGGEYQDHELLSYTRNTTAGADNSVVAYNPSTTARTVKSGYAELFVPIFGRDNARPGLEELSLSAAIRHDEYSDFGSTTNPKFAIRYRPFEGFSLRGTFGKSFRAPTLSDIDPRTLTISVADFTDPSSASGVTRTLWVRGGNDGLGPEKARIWSLGFDYAPAFARGLDLSFTYFNVDYTNRIETPGNTTLALTPAIAAQLGALVQRNPSAALVTSYLGNPLYTGIPEDPANIRAFVDGRKVNIGQLKTQGLEGVISYTLDTDGAGRFNLGLSGTYNIDFKRTTLPNAAPVNVLDTINNPLEFRARGNLGWEQGGFNANAFINHSAGYLNNSVTPVQHVDAYTTVDLSLRYRIEDSVGFGLKNVTFSLDVQNLFDRDPPVVLNGALAFDPQVASILGRFATVGVRANW